VGVGALQIGVVSFLDTICRKKIAKYKAGLRQLGKTISSMNNSRWVGGGGGHRGRVQSENLKVKRGRSSSKIFGRQLGKEIRENNAKAHHKYNPREGGNKRGARSDMHSEEIRVR